MLTKKFLLSILMSLAMLLALSACGQLAIGIESPTPAAADAATATLPAVEAQASETPAPSETPEPAPTNEPSPYWVKVTDAQYGVQFAVPCSWLVNFPEGYGPGAGAQSYAITNYPDTYALEFLRGEGIWEAGGIKIDMNFMDVATWGIAPGASLIDFTNGLYANSEEIRLVSTEELLVNGQAALLVTTESIFGRGQFYLMAVNESIYLVFAPNPEAASNPDVLAILNSIAITPDTVVQIPQVTPGAPPAGLSATCLEAPGAANEFQPAALELDCQEIAENSVDWVACNVQDSIRSRNTAALLSYMVDPFSVGYWRSEGVTMAPDALLNLLQATLLPADPSIPMSFTNLRGLFPRLDGLDPASLVGSQVKVVEIIYSKGWGADRQGEALLYISQNSSGEFKFTNLIYAAQGFE